MNGFESAAKIGATVFATKGSWFRVTGTRGNAKGFTGVQGRLMWVAVDGDPRAWASSPDAERVSRVGLQIEGRTGYLFLNPAHVSPMPAPVSPEMAVAIECMLVKLGAFLSACYSMCDGEAVAA